eukprot:CAMPEP_0181212864 /NCGR_PEP_ID=MMETSP1096-20121128/24591_1 /TAXON_ID=156174 ORGANISM="Chrysochromulina ericina, Strain CCMP281" /NCGR_SAMPLE_ID=MMETSP1096 /ASSEMBLY_ACC=CAM_ASM_000453 /LENGTH=115 /DNA_ID=CAMNT_0023304449 /DNA_START=269 /DNA_END=616 /DNA_ORIENTATION=-
MSRVPVPLQQRERHAVTPAEAHLRNVLASAAPLPGTRRVVLLVHHVISYPPLQVGSQPAPRQIRREVRSAGRAAVLQPADQHLLQRRPGVGIVPLLPARAEGRRHTSDLYQPARL